MTKCLSAGLPGRAQYGRFSTRVSLNAEDAETEAGRYRQSIEASTNNKPDDPRGYPCLGIYAPSPACMNHPVEWAGKKKPASTYDSSHPGSGALVLDEPIWLAHRFFRTKEPSAQIFWAAMRHQPLLNRVRALPAPECQLSPNETRARGWGCLKVRLIADKASAVGPFG